MSAGAGGQSFGVAYLLDAPRHRVNLEMVDIDTLDEDDRKVLRDAVERHHAETGSAVAHGLQLTGTVPPWVAQTTTALAAQGYDATIPYDWADASRLPQPGIMPKDFKRVLQAREAAERDGRDPNVAIMEAAHG